MTKKRIIIISLIVAASIIGVFVALEVNRKHMVSVVERNVIYEGIYIEEIHIGGLSKNDALNLLVAEVQKDEDQKQIKILADGKELHLLPYSYFENEIDYNSLINEAFQVGRNGLIKVRYKEIKKLKKEPKVISIDDKYKNEKFVSLMDNLKPKYEIQPQDAYLERIDNAFVIHDEVIGKTILVDESINAIKEALNKELDTVELVVSKKTPEVTKEVFKDIKDLMGSFFTEFSASQVARNENLRIASSMINGTIIMPNEVFSTNETIGPINTSNGYQEAPIILNGKIQPGIGGGVCQIATTLYNAVLLAELEVVERQNHSLPVGYIEKARDATLAGDYVDFKFKNNTNTPIYIESYINGNQLYMNIYGKETRPAERTIGFESVIIDTIMPPPQKISLDPNLLEGQEVVEKKATIGYTVKLYKIIYNQGQLVDKIQLNTSTYKAVAAEIRRGTLVSSIVTPTTEPAIQVIPEPLPEDHSTSEEPEDISEPLEPDINNNSETTIQEQE